MQEALEESFLQDIKRLTPKRHLPAKRHTVTADEIAKGLSPLNPTSVRIQSSRLLLERANRFIKNKTSFGFESTLAAGTAPEKLIRQAKVQGFLVVLLYFWVSSPDLAMARVRQRVAAGGHDIPEPDFIGAMSGVLRTSPIFTCPWQTFGWFTTTQTTIRR